MNPLFFLFCLVLILMRLPQIYIFPSFFSLAAHDLAAVLILVLFIIIVFRSYLTGKKIIHANNISFLILFYLFTQSISVIKAADTVSFLNTYKNIILGITTYFVTINIIDKKKVKILIYILLFTGLINLVFETVSYFYPQFIDRLQLIFQDKYWNFFVWQYQRNRFFSDILDEILLPFIIIFFVSAKSKFKTAIGLLYISLIAFFTLLSNWRVKLVMFIFSLLASTVLFKRLFKGKILKLFSFIFGFLCIGYFISISIMGINALDRFFLREKEDVKTLYSRLDYWNKSIDIASFSPVIGIGLGNYFNFLSPDEQLANRNSSQTLIGSFIVIEDPHSILFSTLVSSGVMGFISYILLIIYFLKKDLESLKNSSSISVALIIAFWTYYIFALLNPATNFPYQYMFWLLRGTIYSLKYVYL